MKWCVARYIAILTIKWYHIVLFSWSDVNEWSVLQRKLQGVNFFEVRNLYRAIGCNHLVFLHKFRYLQECCIPQHDVLEMNLCIILFIVLFTPLKLIVLNFQQIRYIHLVCSALIKLVVKIVFLDLMRHLTELEIYVVWICKYCMIKQGINCLLQFCWKSAIPSTWNDSNFCRCCLIIII